MTCDTKTLPGAILCNRNGAPATPADLATVRAAHDELIAQQKARAGGAPAGTVWDSVPPGPRRATPVEVSRAEARGLLERSRSVVREAVAQSLPAGGSPPRAPRVRAPAPVGVSPEPDAARPPAPTPDYEATLARPAPADAITHALGWHYRDLRDFWLRLEVGGAPVVLKNGKMGVVTFVAPGKTNRGRRCPSCKSVLTIGTAVANAPRVNDYVEAAVGQLRATWAALFRQPLPADVLVNAAVLSYRATRRDADASNLYQAPEDSLEAARVLENDHQVAHHDGSRRLYDPARPRVVVILTPCHHPECKTPPK